MISVALLEPESAGNVGAVARVMKNFGFKELILINPKCEHLSGEAKARAMHARDLLKSAKVVDSFDSLKYDYLIGTTGKTGGHYNVPRMMVTPEYLSERIPKNGKTILIFGREGIGMLNQELEKCDIIAHIPMPEASGGVVVEYPVMNLSHAVAVFLYEISKADQKRVRIASKEEREAIFSLSEDVINGIKWSKTSSPKTVSRAFRNVINRSFIHKREAHTLAGFFRKIKYHMGK
jgi:tRNA/rRNA methyltransferase